MEKAQTAIEGGNESIEASAESTRINHHGSLPEDIPKVDTRPADPFEVPDGGTAAWLCAFGVRCSLITILWCDELCVGIHDFLYVLCVIINTRFLRKFDLFSTLLDGVANTVSCILSDWN